MITTSVKYLAISQYGNKHFLYTDHPRKELIDKAGGRSARKMYVDDKEGNAHHIGYIVAGEWWTLYVVAGRGIKDK